MNEIQEDLPVLLNSFLKVAQNFAILPYQNLWKQIGKIISITFKIDFFALVSAKKTGKVQIKFTNNTQMVNRFIDKTKEIINSVKKNGFMAIEFVNLEEKYSTAFLPIEIDNSIEAVMIVGQKQEVIFPKITLNVFLAIAGLSGTCIERKRAERRCTEGERRYREAYKRVDLYKDIFAHDVNNLLQSIQSSVDMMLLNQDSLDQSFLDRMIGIIDEQVRRGKRLVENVTKLSEIEDKKALMKVVDAYSVLIQSIDYIRTCFPDKTIKIEVDSENKEVKILFNDLLSDVFDNILLNAVMHNYNEAIQILIKISKTQKNGRQYIKMEFIDNGIGIPDNRKNVIFKGVYRSGKNKIGMGLGLSLVSKTIENIQGDIRVEDNTKGDYSKGSNFILLLLEGN